MPQTIQKEKFFDPRKPFQSQRPETHEEWQARMGGEVLAVVRSGLYLDFRFLDMALSALSPAPDERCRVLATDGQVLFYQPSHLLRLYQDNPKYLNRLYLHTIFHCVFRHLWLKGRREPQLWSLACDIAVENVIDSLNRTSVKRPLTYVRQNAYQQITAEETVVAAAPVYRWLTRQTPGVLRQLEREFVTDDHRLWPKDAPDQPQQMPTPLPQKTWQKIGERMQTELDLRDKEAGDGADALKQQVKYIKRNNKYVDKFIVPSIATKNSLKLCGIDEKKINGVYNGIEINEIKKEGYNYIREKFNISEDKKIICIIGQFCKRKRQDLFIDIVDCLNKKYNNKYVGIIIGKITDKDFYEEMKLKIHDPILFINDMKREEIFKYIYPNIDALILLSDRDPLPTVILEAMSMKTIVIARNVDGVKEIILDQINGFMVDYNFKIEILSTLIEQVMNLNEKDKIKIKNNARKTIQEKFTLEIKKNAINDIINNL